MKIMEPKYIIAAGQVAYEVIEEAIQGINFRGKHIQWAHPAFVRRISYLFDVCDLLKRSPEVDNARKKIKLDEDKHSEFRNMVFYACHCVSKAI